MLDPGASESRVLAVARGAAAGGAAGIVLALVFQTIIGALSFFYTILTVSLFIPVLAGLYLRRVGMPEILGSIAAGVSVVIVPQVARGGQRIGAFTPAMIGRRERLGHDDDGPGRPVPPRRAGGRRHRLRGRHRRGGSARQGAMVHCLDLDAVGAQATVERIVEAGGDATGDALDVRDGAAVDAALASLADRRGRLDVVVATPGVNVRKPLLAYADDEFDRVVGLNLKGRFHAIRAAGRVMRAHRRGSSTSSILLFSIRAQVV